MDDFVVFVFGVVYCLLVYGVFLDIGVELFVGVVVVVVYVLFWVVFEDFFWCWVVVFWGVVGLGEVDDLFDVYVDFWFLWFWLVGG